MYCNYCNEDTRPVKDPDSGSTCCSTCGKILQEDYFTEAPTFEKTNNGQSRLSGTIHRLASEYSASHERTLGKGRDEISYIVDSLSMAGGDSIINPAFNLYKIAVERNFTRGRRTDQVAAACLYIACRQHKLPYLLIEFSNHLGINVYVLGAVFLHLCKLLSLEEHPIVQMPVDPSLFMRRFTIQLLGEDNREVTNTALNIIASMKRDWMQTGRKPSGLCGAALYIAVHSHQLTYSKSAIVNVVHICEATLTKRLIEFENTESGSLTIEELNEMARELEKEWVQNKLPGFSGVKELLCQHKGGSRPHHAHGLCKDCYEEFVTLSGGLEGGAEPPAFQRAEMQRKQLQMAKSNKHPNSDGLSLEWQVDEDEQHMFSYEGRTLDTQHKEHKSAETLNEALMGSSLSAEDESDRLSDIDDTEVNGYLNTLEETKYKTVIWETMNKEYLEEQAEKDAQKAAEAAAKAAYNAKYGDNEEIRAAQELYASSAAAAAKSLKERREKRAAEERKAGPPKNAAEATSRMLKRKTPGSKINFAALEALYTSEQETEKRLKVESDEPMQNGKSEDGLPQWNVEDDAATEGMTEDFYGDGYEGGEYDAGYDDQYNYGNEEELDFF